MSRHSSSSPREGSASHARWTAHRALVVSPASRYVQQSGASGQAASAEGFGTVLDAWTHLPSIHVSSANYGPYPLLGLTLGRRSSSEGAAVPEPVQDRPHPCLLHVCSDVPVRAGSGRHHAAAGLTVCRTARHVIAWPGTRAASSTG